VGFVTYRKEGSGPTHRRAPRRYLWICGGWIRFHAASPSSLLFYESPLTGLIQPPPPHGQVPQFELHRGTELYLRRRQPLLTPELLSQLGKLLGGLGAFVSGILGLYGFLRIVQLRRFEAYYQEVRRIVQIARGLEDDPDAPPDPDARRAYLLDRLDDLKSEGVRDFADGGLKGEGLLAGVVALVNDTRSSLAAGNRAPHLPSSHLDVEPGMSAPRLDLPDTPAHGRGSR
jgi:hypothetical protein